MKSAVKTVYSPARLATQVARMGAEISRDYAGRTLDVVAILEDAFVFAADLVRHITCPVVLHFLRAESHEVTLGGFTRKEVFFSHQPELKGRDVLLVDLVLDTGVTMDFLSKRLVESGPRSLRLAVLLNRPASRRVSLKPDYFGFDVASNYLVGYGLPGQKGLLRNLPLIGSLDGSWPRRTRGAAARKGRHHAGKRGTRVSR